MAAAGKQAKSPDAAAVMEKLRHFCAYQERSRLQAERKIRQLGLGEEEIPELLSKLEEENFLNEDRFVKQFTRSRASVKGWGPRKIAMALYRETGKSNLSPEAEDQASALAMKKLEKDAAKKLALLQAKGDPRCREKLLAFCLSRGFDHSCCYRVVDSLLKSGSN